MRIRRSGADAAEVTAQGLPDGARCTPGRSIEGASGLGEARERAQVVAVVIVHHECGAVGFNESSEFTITGRDVNVVVSLFPGQGC